MKELTHGSLFAGIGGFDLGFERAGFKTAWQVEIEPFCQAVLKTRFPAVERFSDIRECGAHNLARGDCITAGVPCQDVSVAGKRAGLSGSRTGLFYEFARILCELRPAWFVFENVPGLLDSNKGRDFAEVLRILMVECGYGICWRVLDAQYFGLAQRRKRVFIVGRSGTLCPPPILFEPQSSTRHFASRSKARTDIARTIVQRIAKGGFTDPVHDNIICGPLGGSSRTGGFSPNCKQAADGQLVVAPITAGLSKTRHDQDGDPEHLICTPINPDRVREFAGLPEGMDSPRYRALGNAVPPPMAEWIARRIRAVIEAKP